MRAVAGNPWSETHLEECAQNEVGRTARHEHATFVVVSITHWMKRSDIAHADKQKGEGQYEDRVDNHKLCNILDLPPRSKKPEVGVIKIQTSA